jgi:hypothetical protein
MSKNKISYSVDLLKAMDNYIREVIGDEVVLEAWLELGVPDGANYDDLEEIAKDEELVTSIIEAFDHCVFAV